MNKSLTIHKIYSSDLQFQLQNGAGSDAVHTSPIYAYAVCRLATSGKLTGTGLAFTLGAGNKLVCKAIDYLANKYLLDKEINSVMANFGNIYQKMADDPNFRWLGPHKGIVHLALASITNACYDLWAKSKEVPLWKLLLDLSPEEIINTLDLSYLEEVMSKEEALEIMHAGKKTKSSRQGILKIGYKGYDTSIGWFQYSDEEVKQNIKKAMDAGFTAMKLKVGSADIERDIRRAHLVRATAGEGATLMLDANQQWSLPKALEICERLKEINPYWIEEPTHPDDIEAHVKLAQAITPTKIALGEHVPNKIIFKNYLQSGCMGFNQVDAVRVGGISEFITISLLSKKYGIPVVPHVGDMGQIHQHLVLYNHIALNHENLFLEHIPHLQRYFQYPAKIIDGFYQVPQEPGASSDFKKEYY